MSISNFKYPDGEALKDGEWRPVFFSPNFDSPERLVAGVIAYVEGEWKLARASALERLKCLYGAESALAQAAITAGLDELEKQFALNSEPQAEFEISVSGLTLGGVAPAHAPDAFELALRSLRAISSLHSRQREILDHRMVAAYVEDTVPRLEREISRDRLPVLVMESLSTSAPQTRSFFNPHVIRLQKDHSARLLTHRAYVAFTGQKLAANFATLKAGRQKQSVDVSKRLMWDLEQHRDTDQGLLPTRSHEMILYHPAKDDPLITERQFDHIIEVVETLKTEGQNRDIAVKAYESVPVIAEHILAVEGLSRGG